MKIVNDKKNNKTIDLDALIEEAFQKYDAVFFSEIEDELFIYRPLGRKEFKDILSNQNLDDYEKEDTICKTVLIYPEDFDFDDCLAGIPEKLYQDVLEKSCLDPESMFYLLHMHREESEQLGSEMACIIAEAFPSYKIEEIEAWNNFKFMKIYAQAEWILKNIRGVEFGLDVGDYLAELAGITDDELYTMGIKEEPPQQKQAPQPAQQTNPQSIHGESQGKGMSAEQLAAYKEFVKQHPEFADAMQYDSAFTGMESQSMNTIAPANRPGWYHNH